MRSLLKIMGVLALVFSLLGAFPGVAQSNTLDFAIQPPHPSDAYISFNGGTSPLLGYDIAVTSVMDVDSPSIGTLQIVGGRLDFQTGPLTGNTAAGWQFGGGSGSSITITGAIPQLSIAPGTLLLSGTFDSCDVLKINQFGRLQFMISGAAFQDQKNPTLLEYFHLATGGSFLGNFNISFYSNIVSPPEAFRSIYVLSGDLTNTVPIPAPASSLLLGGGLAGLASLGLRRRD